MVSGTLLTKKPNVSGDFQITLDTRNGVGLLRIPVVWNGRHRS